LIHEESIDETDKWAKSKSVEWNCECGAEERWKPIRDSPFLPTYGGLVCIGQVHGGFENNDKHGIKNKNQVFDGLRLMGCNQHSNDLKGQ
jgi:hypothetical protein